MKRINENGIFLSMIAHSPSVAQRQALLKTATQSQILSIAEAVLNTLKGNVLLPDYTLKTLKPYKKDLRRVGTQRKVNWKDRRKTVIKIGKAIQAISQQLFK